MRLAALQIGRVARVRSAPVGRVVGRVGRVGFRVGGSVGRILAAAVGPAGPRPAQAGRLVAGEARLARVVPGPGVAGRGAGLGPVLIGDGIVAARLLAGVGPAVGHHAADHRITPARLEAQLIAPRLLDRPGRGRPGGVFALVVAGGRLDRDVQGEGPRGAVAAHLHAVQGGDRVADRVPAARVGDRDVDRQGAGVALAGGHGGRVEVGRESAPLLGQRRKRADLQGVQRPAAVGGAGQGLIHRVDARIHREWNASSPDASVSPSVPAAAVGSTVMFIVAGAAA